MENRTKNIVLATGRGLSHADWFYLRIGGRKKKGWVFSPKSATNVEEKKKTEKREGISLPFRKTGDKFRKRENARPSSREGQVAWSSVTRPGGGDRCAS